MTGGDLPRAALGGDFSLQKSASNSAESDPGGDPGRCRGSRAAQELPKFSEFLLLYMSLIYISYIRVYQIKSNCVIRFCLKIVS